jgi:thermitase
MATNIKTISSLRGWIWIFVLCFELSALAKSPLVVVAVIDTGIDRSHIELKKDLWENPGETGVDSKGRDKASNGVDDDGNGFIDDINGWNFVDHTANLNDEVGHGTHIAGIVLGKAKGPGTSQSTKNDNIKVMALKYYDPRATGIQNLRNSISAFHYAMKMGAQIINYSGGGLTPQPEERAAVAVAEQMGIPVVAAAGNEQANSDLQAFFPANYGFSNIVSVAAANANGQLLPSSNFGRSSVMLAAPGEKIESTMPRGKRGIMSGTSQATAFVSRALALIFADSKSMNVKTDWKEAIQRLMVSVEFSVSLEKMVKSEGRLNTRLALNMQGPSVDAFGERLSTSKKTQDFEWEPTE